MTTHGESDSRPQSANLTSPDSATGESIERLRRVTRLPVMYPRLQRLCGPQSENFWVIGGRPGDFKTALLWNLALSAAEMRRRVLFVSLEMTAGEMGLLALARFSGLDRRRIQEHFMPDGTRFSPEELDAFDGAALKFRGLEMYLRLHNAEEHGRSIEEVLKSACRSRFDAVMVDHLGMIGRDSGGRELEMLSDSIHRLRGLSRGEAAKNYRPWVVATSQLNREIDKGEEDRIPRMSDFRGSARIEHDTDVVIGLQRRKASGDESPTAILDGFVLKNRNGPPGVVLLFEANGATGLVVERHRDPDAPPRHWQEGD